MKQIKIWLSIIGLLAVIGGGWVAFHQSAKQSAAHITTVSVQKSNTFSYKGEDGKSALAILQETASVTFASSGLVIAINGRKADDTRHEYWAFYINGKMADVGPKDYQTKSTDTIEWRIATY